MVQSVGRLCDPTVVNAMCGYAYVDICIVTVYNVCGSA